MQQQHVQQQRSGAALTRRLIQFGYWALSPSTHYETACREADLLMSPSQRFVTERAFEAGMVGMAWTVTVIPSILFVIAVAWSVPYADYSTRASVINAAAVVPAFCLTGLSLQVLRVVGTGLAKVGKTSDQLQDYVPGGIVRWLLTPRDSDLLFQAACAAAIIIHNLGAWH